MQDGGSQLTPPSFADVCHFRVLCVAGAIDSMLVPRTKAGVWTTGWCRLPSWTKCTTHGSAASSARETREADDPIMRPSSCASSKQAKRERDEEALQHWSSARRLFTVHCDFCIQHSIFFNNLTQLSVRFCSRACNWIELQLPLLRIHAGGTRVCSNSMRVYDSTTVKLCNNDMR